jgi:hypothetical protein
MGGNSGDDDGDETTFITGDIIALEEDDGPPISVSIWTLFEIERCKYI